MIKALVIELDAGCGTIVTRGPLSSAPDVLVFFAALLKLSIKGLRSLAPLKGSMLSL